MKQNVMIENSQLKMATEGSSPNCFMDYMENKFLNSLYSPFRKQGVSF